MEFMPRELSWNNIEKEKIIKRKGKDSKKSKGGYKVVNDLSWLGIANSQHGAGQIQEIDGYSWFVGQISVPPMQHATRGRTNNIVSNWKFAAQESTYVIRRDVVLLERNKNNIKCFARTIFSILKRFHPAYIRYYLCSYSLLLVQ